MYPATKRSANTSTVIYALGDSTPLASINTAMMPQSALLGKVRLSSFICSISREALQNVIVLLYALSDFRWTRQILLSFKALSRSLQNLKHLSLHTGAWFRQRAPGSLKELPSKCVMSHNYGSFVNMFCVLLLLAAVFQLQSVIAELLFQCIQVQFILLQE